MGTDLISRQAAVDKLAKCSVKEVTPSYMLIDKGEALKELMMLPPTRQEIITCKDCKWKNQHNCTRAVEVFIDDNKYCAWAERG